MEGQEGRRKMNRGKKMERSKFVCELGEHGTVQRRFTSFFTEIEKIEKCKSKVRIDKQKDKYSRSRVSSLKGADEILILSPNFYYF